MSNNYDALKKVEQSKIGASNSDNKKVNKQPKLIYLIYILMVFVGFFIAKLIFNTFIDKTEIKNEKTPPFEQPYLESKISSPASSLTSPLVEEPVLEPPVPEKKLPPSLSLNGIFFDDKQPYALVNNQIVKKGDVIEGAKIVSILAGEVDLEFEGEPIKLKTSR